ncbi:MULTISPECIES: hypothetical protein [unclassified Mesorhizobium]|uniref:hypothetical protein n=1 Tax=unclassified Mesorhizobium TaxID=325217 RepID=UPI000801809C|nr:MULTISPECIES: hypothetical protein [unclassified Mesorhizobium]OBQ74174.1 hypothetical protein A9K71_13820 [Mesorhizobium sp. WSM3873]PBB30840.1 hypothetical protein CK221_28285 [Mesorhizobium sp. WSM3868]PBB95843.1 hypothetical protein CK224_24775 [Mesorhizobium sp. WSM3862]
MDTTGWMRLAVLLLAFAVIAAFALRKMFLPAPKESASGETIAGSNGFNEAHNSHYSAGHGGARDD